MLYDCILMERKNEKKKNLHESHNDSAFLTVSGCSTASKAFCKCTKTPQPIFELFLHSQLH